MNKVAFVKLLAISLAPLLLLVVRSRLTARSRTTILGFTSLTGSTWHQYEGKRASELIPAVDCCIEALGTECTSNYWDATAGNAGYMLAQILPWLRQHPTATLRLGF